MEVERAQQVDANTSCDQDVPALGHGGVVKNLAGASVCVEGPDVSELNSAETRCNHGLGRGPGQVHASDDDHLSVSDNGSMALAGLRRGDGARGGREGPGPGLHVQDPRLVERTVRIGHQVGSTAATAAEPARRAEVARRPAEHVRMRPALSHSRDQRMSLTSAWPLDLKLRPRVGRAIQNPRVVEDCKLDLTHIRMHGARTAEKHDRVLDGDQGRPLPGLRKKLVALARVSWEEDFADLKRELLGGHVRIKTEESVTAAQLDGTLQSNQRKHEWSLLCLENIALECVVAGSAKNKDASHGGHHLLLLAANGNGRGIHLAAHRGCRSHADCAPCLRGQVKPRGCAPRPGMARTRKHNERSHVKHCPADGGRQLCAGGERGPHPGLRVEAPDVGGW
eukprot:472100-Rhodomonas_salina.5